MKFNWLAVLGVAVIGASGCRTVHQTEFPTNIRQNQGLISLGKADQANSGSTPAVSEASGTIHQVAYIENGQPQDNGFILGKVAVECLAFEPGNNQQSGGMSLSDFESLAAERNPTIQELAATTQKAAGYRTQVGLRPNPTAGYQASQLADQGTDQHVFFVEQEFVRGGKLQLNRQVLNETLRAQLFELEAQKLRVATDVRVKFYQALAAQRRMQLIADFRLVADEGLLMSERLVEAGEATKIDAIQSKIQKNEIELSQRQAKVAFESAWRELAAIVGTPELSLTQLVGELPDHMDSPLWNELASSIIASSPEYAAAQVRINRAKSNLQRQNVQAIPNLTAQLGAGVDNATDSGLINFQLSAPIPVFNQNHGNIAAARAEYCRSMRESERIENAIQARLAAVSNEFDSSLAAIRQYADEILPSAKESLELAEESYRAGEANFVQVLVARKTYFDSNLQYVAAQAQLAQAQAKIDGHVLTGSFDPVRDDSGDDSLRGLTFGQQ